MSQIIKTQLGDQIDGVSKALMTVEYAHHEIHSGSHFRVQANADAAASSIIAFKVPDQTKQPHFIFKWITESSGYLQLLEGPTWTTSTGSDLAPKNSNRSSAKTSVLQGDATGAFVADNVVINPTGLSGGAVISDIRVYTDNRQGGESGGRGNEIVLDTDQTYALKWTSTDGNKGIQIRCAWYEHSPASVSYEPTVYSN